MRISAPYSVTEKSNMRLGMSPLMQATIVFEEIDNQMIERKSYMKIEV